MLSAVQLHGCHLDKYQGLIATSSHLFNLFHKSNISHSYSNIFKECKLN